MFGDTIDREERYTHTQSDIFNFLASLVARQRAMRWQKGALIILVAKVVLADVGL
jgi:hypothetical protein